jgi:hypothetical protein
MCFSAPKPPPPPAPDPAVEAQKQASFEASAAKLAAEKDSSTDASRARAYGFYGTRSMLGQNAGGNLLYVISQGTPNQ